LGKSENEGLMLKTETHLFHSYDLHGESSLTPTRFLFNNAKHLRLQSEKNLWVYEILLEDTRAVKARIAFHIKALDALSPLRAPYGFLEIYKKVSTDELSSFFSFIEADLKVRGAKRIYLKSYPEVYDKNFGLVEGVLKKLHYSSRQEVSSIIRVDRKPFEKKIKVSERQKLRKAALLFSFEAVHSGRVKEIYSFIKECRKEKNQTLSMSFSELKKVVAEFPENFFFYHLFDSSGTAAAAIVIKISPEILYTFYYAHARRFDKVSPVVFLIAKLYEAAHDEGFEMIDLGTSMVNGKINRSLLHFKTSIGGQNSRKLIFEKELV
jgi:hypothetical protein